MSWYSQDQASQKFEPPEHTAGRYPGAMQRADELASTPYSQYQGQRVAEYSPLSHGANQLVAGHALYGAPDLNAGRGTLMSVATGGAANPYIDPRYSEAMIASNAQNMNDAFARGTAVQNDAMFTRQGAFGGSGWREKQAVDAAEHGKAVGNMAANVRSQQYDKASGMWADDVGRAMEAAKASLPFGMFDLQSYEAMNKAGQQQQNYLQSLLSEGVSEHERQQAHPFDMFKFYMDSLAAGSGGMGTAISNPGRAGVSPMNVAGTGMGMWSMLQQAGLI